MDINTSKIAANSTAAAAEASNAESSTSGRSTTATNDTTPKTRRPKDVALTQQRMKSWQPLLDPKWIIITYLCIGVIFIPTGELFYIVCVLLLGCCGCSIAIGYIYLHQLLTALSLTSIDHLYIPHKLC